MNININPLSANLTNVISPNQSIAFDTTDRNEFAFSNVLADSLRTAGLADHADKTSALELMIGQSDDLSGLLLDAQKAELSLNLAIQIRNRVLDAYNEVMRMQV